LGSFIFKFARATICFLGPEIKKLLVIVKFLAVPVEFFINLELQDTAIEVTAETTAKFNP
jgi:hypothetical protein